MKKNESIQSRIIRAIRMLLVLLVTCASSAFSQNVPQADARATGAKKISPRIFEKIGKVAPLAGAPIGQSRVSWRESYPPPRDQGNINSCVPFAICYSAKSFLERKRNGWKNFDDSKVFAPSYIYGQFEHDHNPGQDSTPMYIQAGLTNLAGGGCPTWKSLPYDPQKIQFPFGNNAILDEARDYERDKWDAVNIKDIKRIREYLSAGHAIIIGASVDNTSAWKKNAAGVTEKMAAFDQGYHCMVVIGYDDHKSGEDNGAFEILNSWGPEWNGDGYAWISYDFWKTFVNEGYILWDNKKLRENDTPLPSGTSFNDVKSIPPGPNGTLNGNWGYPDNVNLKKLQRTLASDKKLPKNITDLFPTSPFR